MRNLLLASAAAAVSLALALPASAQSLPNTVPAAPPVSTEIPDADAALEGAAAATITTPEGQVVESQTEAEAQANADSPEAAAAAATAMASSPAAPINPAAETDAVPAIAIPANASAACQPRITTVHFGARGSALNRENRNAIEYAVDAASVCDLQQVLITDSSEGRISSRRAGAVRAALIARGVPAENISVAEEANADAQAASTGRLDVRMTFAGVADSSTPVTTVEPRASPNS